MPRNLLLVIVAFASFALGAQSTDTAAVGTTPPTPEPVSASGKAADSGAKEQAEPKPKSPNAYQTVNGLENWNYDYDISDLKSGVYNILVRGTDTAGNVAEAGPFNIIIDPKSDLPIAQISNPSPSMRVGSHLNIVGTCVDDDAVKRVEIKLDDQEWVQAKGTEFWSYFLDVTDIPDGSHIIRVRGFDIKEVVGDTVQVRFNLDKFKPLNEIQSPSAGALVKETITIKGLVNDANEVRKVEYSSDGGKAFKDLPFRREGPDDTKVSFDLVVDTRKIADGPAVYWFKGTDKVGSVGVSAFLFFVDNTKPTLEILQPEKDSRVYGEFSVTGRIYDKVGLKELKYSYGKDEGLVELLPGDPYFSLRFDTRGSKEPQARVNLSVEDNAGNITLLSLSYTIDFQADKPVVTILTPKPQSFISDELLVSGSVRDGEGVKQIEWSLDGKLREAFDCESAFAFPVKDILPGAHTIGITGIDVNGIKGDPSLVQITVVGKSPEISFKKATVKDGAFDFFPGIELSSEAKAVLACSIDIRDQLVSAQYTVGGGKPEKITLPSPQKPGEFAFGIPLPAAIPFGVVPIAVSVTDVYNRSTNYSSFVYITNYSKIREEPGIVFVDARIQADGSVRLGTDKPLVGYFVRETIEKAEFDPPTAVVEVSFEGSSIFVRPIKEGLSGRTKLRVTTSRKHIFESQEFEFIFDETKPLINLTTPETGMWVQGSVSAEGLVTDPNGIRNLAYSMDRNTWTDIAFNETTGAFSSVLSLGDGEQTSVLSFRATDRGGNESSLNIGLNVDAKIPELTIITPRPDDSLKGTTTFLAKILERPEALKSVEISEDGVNFSPLPTSLTVLYRTNLSSAKKLVLRVKDKSGNLLEKNLAEGMRVEIPEFPPQPPAELGTMKTNMEAYQGSGFVLKGSDSIGALGFGVPFLNSASEAELPPEVTAGILATGMIQATVDLVGISLDAKKPTAYIENSPFKELTALSVQAQKNPGEYQFNLKIDTTKLPEGRNVLWFRLPDIQAGADKFVPLILVVDNTKPFLEFFEPTNAPTHGKFIVAGRVLDSKGIASLKYEMGTEKGDFDLNPADPYFAKEFSVPQGANSPVSVSVVATDGAGNKSVAVAKPVIDAKTDLPTVGFILPVPGRQTRDYLDLVGWASDDDGISRVSFQIDKSPAMTLEISGGVFLTRIGPFQPGSHGIEMKAVDANGLEGKSVSTSVVCVLPEPLVSFDTVVLGTKQSIPYAPGMSALLDKDAKLAGTITAKNSLASAEFLLDDAPPAKLNLVKDQKNPDISYFEIPFPAGHPYSRISLKIRAIDSYKQTTEYSGFLYKLAPPSPEGIDDQEKIYISDKRITEEGRITLLRDKPLVSFFNGREIASVSLEPATTVATVGNEKGKIVIQANEDGITSSGTKVKVTTIDGDLFETAPLTYIVDEAPPELAVELPNLGDWITEGFRIKGSAQDANGIELAEYSLDGGASYTAFAELSKGPSSDAGRAEKVSFAKDISVSELKDGAISVFVRVKDASGKATFWNETILKDSTPPEIGLVAPEKGATVNGTISLTAVARDAGVFTKIEFSEDGEKFEELAAKPRGFDDRTTETDASTGKSQVVLNTEVKKSVFEREVDFSRLAGTPEKIAFKATDRSGNIQVFRPLAADNPLFAIDSEADKPVTEIQTPAEMEVMRGDFVISGMSFDDDRLAVIYVRIDGGEWRTFKDSNSFSIQVRLTETTDNEHVVEAYAEDINGVSGNVSKRTYRISKAEPIAELIAPRLDVTNRGVIYLEGTASDKNGIREVFVSFDNGLTFNRAQGAEDWRYRLDTRILKDGVYNVQVRIIDKYDTEGFYSSLISVDNTAPTISLDRPKDGDVFSEIMNLDGRAEDTIVLEKLGLEIRALENPEAKPFTMELSTKGVFVAAVDTTALKPGWYNVRITGNDHAQNTSYIARNIQVKERTLSDKAEIIFPSDGESITGNFAMYGRVVSKEKINNVVVLLDKQPISTSTVNKLGYFTYNCDPKTLEDGPHTFRVQANLKDGTEIISDERRIDYKKEGAWISIDSFATGDFVYGRPWLQGSTGWYLEEPDKEDKEAYAIYKKDMESHRVRLVEVSRDNGKIFTQTIGTQAWKMRLETQEYPAGDLRLIVRSTYEDGTTVVRKTILNVDTSPPRIVLLVPSEGGSFNEHIAMSGTAKDENGMSKVEVIVRPGDKESYKLPSFIQGSFLDLHVFGATRWEGSIGLTFFEENVKLQAGIGQAFDVNPTWENLLGFQMAGGIEPAVFGNVLSARLLANVFFLPFGYYLGPDWDFFSMSLSLGATFTYFSLQTDFAKLFDPPRTELSLKQRIMILSGLTGQWEFAKFTFGAGTIPKSVSLYFEMGLTFFPSDVEARVFPNMGFGSRIGLF